MTEQFAEFSTFNAERGRLMSASEVARAIPVVVIGWEIADRLFGAVDPLEKTLQIEGVHFRIVGVSAKRGHAFWADRRTRSPIIPLRQFQMMFGARRQLSLTVKPQDISQLDQAMDDATLALRIARRLRPKQADNFGLFTSETFLSLYRQATNGIFAVLVGIVALSLVGRRHRHHEHHADGGDRADARDRPAQGARRAALRHHGADAHRVGGAVGAWRRRRRRPGLDLRDRGLAVHADHRVGRALVGRARHRHHRAGGTVLRPVSGGTGRALDPIEALEKIFN